MWNKRRRAKFSTYLYNNQMMVAQLVAIWLVIVCYQRVLCKVNDKGFWAL